MCEFSFFLASLCICYFLFDIPSEESVIAEGIVRASSQTRIHHVFLKSRIDLDAVCIRGHTEINQCVKDIF